MTDMTHKPVVLLAFANDRNGSVGQLLNLPDEERRLREKLEAAPGLCEFVSRSNCTADDIFKVLQDARYRNRIAIFHFSGHANSLQLLLETRDGQTAAADASGFASFLAAQHGLRIVFLNGCSTRQQTQRLLDANKNLAAVIATSRAIDDRVAIDFSERFYAALAQGTTLRTAFDEAKAAITTTRGSDHRKLYFGDADKETPDDSRDSSGAPWNLYEREGSAEIVGQWSLPGVANDPLFGLPPLDETNLPESPYKHLNWFTNDDAEIFFGRGRQIREMYDALTSGSQPVILFYGQSGVGKSSLLDAGLLPRLEKSCEVRYARRGDKGLLATLKQMLGLAANDATPIETAWRAGETQLGKPLSVILDQVEECYTRPIQELPDELDQLLTAVEATFGNPAQRPRGRLVLSFREEWLARLEDEVKTFRLPRTKIFLKPLDCAGIIEVVQGPTSNQRLRERYALTIDDGLAGEIADDLLADRGSAIATTLQILLSKLWDTATEIRSEPPKFTRGLYLDLKRDGILLGDFLQQQLQAFEGVMPEPAKSGLLLDVLAQHTTSLGTANQSSREQLLEQYSHVSNVLPGLLKHCQDLYLLTVPTSTEKRQAQTTRLAHDTLAPLVREQFDVSDKPGQRARRILNNRSVDWEDDREGTPLDETDLKVVEQGASGTRVWSPIEQRLVKVSRNRQTRLQRTRKIVRIAASVAVALIVVFAGIAVWQWRMNARLVTEKEKAITDEQLATKDAETRGRIALSRHLAMQSQAARKDSTHALLLAAESVLTTLRVGEKTEPAAEQALRDALASTSGIGAGHPKEFVSAVDLSFDETRLAVGYMDGSVRLWTLGSIGAEGESEIFEGHKLGVTAIGISPGGRWLASGSDDTNVQLWDLTRPGHKPFAVLDDHTESVTALAFSPDDRWLATGSWPSEQNVMLWDLLKPEDGITKHQLREQGQSIWKLAFSADSKRLAAATTDGTAEIWNLPPNGPIPGPVIARGHVPPKQVTSVQFGGDGQSLVTGGMDSTIRIWDLQPEESPTQTNVLKAKWSVYAVAVSADQRWVAGAVEIDGEQQGTEMDVVLWDLDAQTPSPISLHRFGAGVELLRFSSDQEYLLAVGKDGTIRRWPISPLVRSASPVVVENATSSAVDQNGSRLAIGTKSGTVLVCDLTKLNPITESLVLTTGSEATGAGDDRSVVRVIFGPQQWLAGVTAKNELMLWNIDRKNAEYSPCVLLKESMNQLDTLRVTPDGRWLIATSRFRPDITLWDLTKKDPAMYPIVLPDKQDLEFDDPQDSLGRVITLSDHGRWMAVLNIDADRGSKDIKVFDLAAITSAEMGSLTFDAAGSDAVSFDPTESTLFSAGIDGVARAWKLSNGRDVSAAMEFPHGKHSIGVHVSPDGRWLITSDNIGLIIPGRIAVTRLWDLSKGLSVKRPYTLGGVPEKRIEAFSPDGHWLITSGDEGTIEAWNLHSSDSSNSRKVLMGHTGWVQSVVFHGDKLFTSSLDGNVIGWDLVGNRPNPIIFPGREWNDSIMIGDSGRWLIAFDRQQGVRLWPLHVPELVDIARDAAGRNLSHGEWERAFPGEPYRPTFIDNH